MKNFYSRPKKSLGQNFLIDENIARKIVLSLSLESEDHILEIGGGYGILTKYIVPQVKKIIVVEIDRNLNQYLNAEFGNYSNFHLIEGNFLDLSLKDILLPEQKWKVIGNIPYQITGSVIFKIFDVKRNVQSLTIMIQKEVAQRIIAGPNTKQYGILSVISYLYANVKILFYVSRNVFSPKPNIESAVVQWNFLPRLRYAIDDESYFVQMVKAIFRQRRKVIRNSLKSIGVNIDDYNFPMNKRPEQLSVAELVTISNLITYGRKRH